MEIKVIGEAEKYVKPDQISLNLRFFAKAKSYDKALESGVISTKAFCKIMSDLKIKLEDLKTSSFMISKSRKYNEKTRQYIEDGFEFSQSATLKFDYDIKFMSKIIELIAQQKNPPTYTINFGLKDEKIADKELTKLAIEDANRQAENIALACGKKIKDCLEASFDTSSKINFFSNVKYERVLAKENIAQDIQEVFVPEDIKLSKMVYTLWRCE